MSDDTNTPRGSSDYRVRELMSGEVSQADLDPQTIAELAAWFGPPRSAAPSPEAEHTSPELEEVRARRERAMEAVDPAFLAAIEERARQRATVLSPKEPPRLAIELAETHFVDFSAWSLGLTEIGTRQIPDEIHEALAERSPQAILRDLHRPVASWPLSLAPKTIYGDPDGSEGSQRRRALIQQRYQIRAQELPHASKEAKKELAGLRERLEEPWETIYIPEDKRHASSTTPSAEHFAWMHGFDPER